MKATRFERYLDSVGLSAAAFCMLYFGYAVWPNVVIYVGKILHELQQSVVKNIPTYAPLTQ